MEKKFEATVQEVFRNFQRLAKADLIVKDAEGDYSITTYGKIVCSQISSLRFLTGNRKYFKNHDFGDVPKKFLQRIGSLETGKQIKGFVNVLEHWKEIYKNSTEYICNILYEVPYGMDLIDPLVKKLESGVKLNSILSETSIIPKERKQVFDKLGFKKLIEKGLLERKMKSNVSVVVILNEKEGMIMFPNKAGEVDLSEGFYSDNAEFQEWCHDYFNHCWNLATPFQEGKLNKRSG